MVYMYRFFDNTMHESMRTDLRPECFDDVINRARHMFGRMSREFKVSGPGFLVVAIADPPNRFPFLACALGEGKPEVIQLHHDYAREQVRRLARTMFEDGHRSSWQSRCLDLSQRGGAISTTRYILAQSSDLPEAANEACMLSLAVCLRLLSQPEAEEIAKITRNPYFPKIYEDLEYDGSFGIG